MYGIAHIWLGLIWLGEGGGGGGAGGRGRRGGGALAL